LIRIKIIDPGLCQNGERCENGWQEDVMKCAWSLLALTVLLVGCVSQRTYEEKVTELAAVQGELSACREQAKSDLEAWDNSRRRFETDVFDCLKQAEDARMKTEALKAREIELKEKLQQEIIEKNVEISRLRDQLSVRVLDKILFRSGSAEILSEGKTVLDKVAGAVQTSDEMIRVEGHTDNVPIGHKLKEKYYSNWELSGARAASVVRYFELGHGITATRLEAVGLSIYRPVAPNDTPENKQRNRRVEIVLTAREVKEPGVKSESESSPP
jgi:chemotaxis protein MotB